MITTLAKLTPQMVDGYGCLIFYMIAFVISIIFVVVLLRRNKKITSRRITDNELMFLFISCGACIVSLIFSIVYICHIITLYIV